MELRMFEVRLWIENSWIALNCVHVMFFSAEDCNLLYSACMSTLLLSLPLFSSLQPSASPAKSVQHRYDYVPWQKWCAYIIVFMSACACVHHSMSYLEDKLVEHLTEDERIFFQRKRNKSDSKRYTALLWGLQEYFLLSMDSTSPGKPSCDSTSCTWPISFIFTVLTITPHSQAICYLPACADSIWTQLSSFAFLLRVRVLPSFFFFIPYHPAFAFFSPSHPTYWGATSFPPLSFPRPGRSFGARQRSTVFLCYFQGLSLDNNCSHSGSPTHQQPHIWGFTFP